MGNLVGLPLLFLKFWFIEAPFGIIRFYSILNRAFFDLFSLPLLLRTYFKPLKNEYREGLVRFSIFMGIGVKSVLILANLLLFIPLVLGEIALLILFVLFPLLTFGLLI